MTAVVEQKASIHEMTIESIDKIRHLEKFALKEPQVSIKTEHSFHAGVYARTITVPAGTMMTGVVVKIPTVLIIYGNCRVFTGNEYVDFEGYNVVDASAPRKMALLAFEEVKMTMVFATDATSVEVAEEQFTDEVDQLVTRKALLNANSGDKA